MTRLYVRKGLFCLLRFHDDLRQAIRLIERVGVGGQEGGDGQLLSYLELLNGSYKYTQEKDRFKNVPLAWRRLDFLAPASPRAPRWWSFSPLKIERFLRLFENRCNRLQMQMQSIFYRATCRARHYHSFIGAQYDCSDHKYRHYCRNVDLFHRRNNYYLHCKLITSYHDYCTHIIHYKKKKKS